MTVRFLGALFGATNGMDREGTEIASEREREYRYHVEADAEEEAWRGVEGVDVRATGGRRRNRGSATAERRWQPLQPHRRHSSASWHHCFHQPQRKAPPFHCLPI